MTALTVLAPKLAPSAGSPAEAAPTSDLSPIEAEIWNLPDRRGIIASSSVEIGPSNWTPSVTTNLTNGALRLSFLSYLEHMGEHLSGGDFASRVEDFIRDNGQLLDVERGVNADKIRAVLAPTESIINKRFPASVLPDRTLLAADVEFSYLASNGQIIPAIVADTGVLPPLPSAAELSYLSPSVDEHTVLDIVQSFFTEFAADLEASGANSDAKKLAAFNLVRKSHGLEQIPPEMLGITPDGPALPNSLAAFIK